MSGFAGRRDSRWAGEHSGKVSHFLSDREEEMWKLEAVSALSNANVFAVHVLASGSSPARIRQRLRQSLDSAACYKETTATERNQ